MDRIAACLNCHGTDLYRSREISAGGGHAPNYLPGLGRFLVAQKFFLVVCADCGFARFFVRQEGRPRLRESSRWTRVTSPR
jgi:predicted nucleic-acid-binding Zn-ribbon protein